MIHCDHCGAAHNAELFRCPQTQRIFAPERLFPPGTLIEGKYRIDDLLGSGGMAAVFRAHHVLLDKPVAIKVMMPDAATNPELRARMVQEARAASATGHPNIALVTDMGFLDDGNLFLVMEYVDGLTLAEVSAREGPLRPQRAVEIVAQVLSGLAAVHSHGIVHRDLKPENIMLSAYQGPQERVKILDFGIAKAFGEAESLDLTTAGMILGSPRYMAPEQARGDRTLDHRVDVYATGALLYTLVVGAPPLSAPNYHAILIAILENKIVPPSVAYAPLRECPFANEIDTIILRAMAGRREDRYDNAASFLRDLSPLLDKGRTSATDEPENPVADANFTVEENPAMEPAAFDSSRLEDGVSIQATPAAAPPAAAPQTSAQQASRFAPPVVEDDTPLALAHVPNRPSDHTLGVPPKGQAAQRSPSGPGRTLYRAPSRMGSWIKRGMFALLLVLGLGASWKFRGRLLSRGNLAIAPSKTVMLFVETEPRQASVYIDGVRQSTQPTELPRSNRYFNISIGAPGYRSRSFQVQASKTQSLRVKLERLATTKRRATRTGTQVRRRRKKE